VDIIVGWILVGLGIGGLDWTGADKRRKEEENRSVIYSRPGLDSTLDKPQPRAAKARAGCQTWSCRVFTFTPS
jgi:hypothetical protein